MVLLSWEYGLLIFGPWCWPWVNGLNHFIAGSRHIVLGSHLTLKAHRCLRGEGESLSWNPRLICTWLAYCLALWPGQQLPSLTLMSLSQDRDNNSCPPHFGIVRRLNENDDRSTCQISWCLRSLWLSWSPLPALSGPSKTPHSVWTTLPPQSLVSWVYQLSHPCCRSVWLCWLRAGSLASPNPLCHGRGWNHAQM